MFSVCRDLPVCFEWTFTASLRAERREVWSATLIADFVVGLADVDGVR